MPDWRRFVGRRLRALNVPRARRDEIERELAGHLEDSYERSLQRGEVERRAARSTLAGAGRWNEAVRGIQSVEGVMPARLKTLWLPGAVSSVAAVVLLMSFARIPGTSRFISFGPDAFVPHTAIFFNWAWLLTLPLLGAAGAEWSRRHRGGRIERLAVALFPAFAMLVLFALASVLGGGLPDGHLAPWLRFTKLAMALFSWVGLPALALLLGGIVVIRRPGPGEATA
jgi:hypothetical protein